MELKVHLPDQGDFYFNRKSVVLARVKEAYIGTLFMELKAGHDKNYHDGLISAAEYARFLATAAEAAHQTAAEIFG